MTADLRIAVETRSFTHCSSNTEEKQQKKDCRRGTEIQVL
jgi:hypothetical protein